MDLGIIHQPRRHTQSQKFEILPATEDKFLSFLVDGKEVTSDVTTPYAIKVGLFPAVQMFSRAEW